MNREEILKLAERLRAVGAHRAADTLERPPECAPVQRVRRVRSPGRWRRTGKKREERSLVMKGGIVKLWVGPWSGVWRVMRPKQTNGGRVSCEAVRLKLGEAMRAARRIARL